MLIASWDGRRLSGWDAGRVSLVLDAVGEGGEDDWQLPDWSPARPEAAPDVLILPLEMLLVRPFTLPLVQPRLLDVDVLAQDFAARSGIEPEDWWLAWRAVACEGGVTGLAFGLPRAAMRALTAREPWKSCPAWVPDAWCRLTGWLPDDGENGVAVLDADEDGLFLGFWQQGAWRGMRRLNLAAGRDRAAIMEDALRSLQAMGFEADAMQVAGRLDDAWREAATWLDDARWRGETVAGLPPRAEATFRDAARATLADAPNFRHGPWAARGDWRERFRPWRLSAALAAGLALMLLGGDLYRLHRLNAEQAAIQEGIVAAFHRGLPQEKVMLDPLAQLRKAAGGGAGGGDVWNLPRQLQMLGRLQQQVPSLKVSLIEYDGGVMRLGGRAPDLATVNRIRDALAALAGVAVQLDDTDMTGGEVRFRLHWRGGQV